MRTFTIDKEPYEEGEEFYSNDSLTIKDNSTICLIGCNGSGKSTVVKTMIEHAEHIYDSPYKGLENILSDAPEKPTVAYVDFDKKTDQCSSEEKFFRQAGILSFSSTGEGIIQRYGRTLEQLGNYIRSHKDTELYIFFDDCDAGTSIDMINDITNVVRFVTKDCKQRNINYHIILTANSYELCRYAPCVSVHDFSEKTFASYEEYKDFVLDSRAIKEQRYK